MILVRNLSLPPDAEEEHLKYLAAEKLRVSPSEIREWVLRKRSLDARRKDRIRFVCSVSVSLRCSEEKILRRNGSPDIAAYLPPCYRIPECRSDERPVIVGFGPAGMFAALVLSRAGLRPIVIERGQEVSARRSAVALFHAGGVLDPENNVQFGEGGAGTFSDGKLNTGTHDPRISWVLEQFHAHGAPASVCYDAKPHIGTDILVDVVRSIREEILSLGGEVQFGTRMTSLEIQDGTLRGVHLQRGEAALLLTCRHVILAIGHSARDTFEALHAQGVPMERKPFAMGVRIEHRQEAIDLAQYGRPRLSLPPADYSLHAHLPDGSSVFSFCMCPGGRVIAAASEEGGVVTNGMSYSARDGENANSALLVGLKPEQFPGEGILAGMYWQRTLEQAAFRCSGSYLAPAQRIGDFLSGIPSSGPTGVLPSYEPGVVWTDLHTTLPPQITAPLAAALPLFGRQLKGFDDPDAVLTGPETRSSSPVRILRGGTFSSPVEGLYPCGEGAGYAGGITSAAVDGMRCAEALIYSVSNC